MIGAIAIAVAPLRLEFMSWWQAALLYALLSAPVVWLGARSLAGLGPVRRWVALGARLAVMGVAVLAVAGARWQRENRDVEVLVLRDVSASTRLVDPPAEGATLGESIDAYLQQSASPPDKPPDDRVGVISFAERALVDAMPNTALVLNAAAIRGAGAATDAAAAIQLALATFAQDARRRIVMLWDGNDNAGDLEAALSAASAAGIPIDVMPMRYAVQRETMVDRLIAPAWRREGEPFSLEVVLRNSGATPAGGRLRVLQQDVAMDLDETTPGVQPERRLVLNPGASVVRVAVAAPGEAGVHQFRAVFEPDAATDTLAQNNEATAFTFVRGRGRVLCVENVPGEAGRLLREALRREGIELDDRRRTTDQFPATLTELQGYDAVLLVNVPRGAAGLSDAQQEALASYVHDLGGGLVMVGGEESFGAGGWQGSRLEQVLPVNMDIPAQRQIPKGALVLVMHSTEMPEGNYWGEQCALKAIETLSSRDEVGVISFDWQAGGAQWDYPLSEKGDGSRVNAAVKNMRLGDMPSFDDTLDLALNGRDGVGGLLQSNARSRHIIVLSDGDPQRPADRLIRACVEHRITISTITVFPHDRAGADPPPVMREMAQATRGRAYGPVNAKPDQLPQIFTKEATVVRRSLIQENSRGIPVRRTTSPSDLAQGIDAPPPVFGMVLTTPKPNPRVETPLVAGVNSDPVLAHWQSGLGKSAAFTSDAHNRWSAAWVGSPLYAKFWSQVVRGVARAPMSNDLDVRVVQEGRRARVLVEALTADAAFLNFLSVQGQVVGPDLQARALRLVQTGPGTYEGSFDAGEAGNHVAVLNWRGGGGRGGVLLGGLSVHSTPEMRDLSSNEARLRRVAEATGGRVLSPFDAGAAGFFDRAGLSRSVSFLPVWDLLVAALAAMLLADVAIRRIAWNAEAMRRGAAAAADRVRGVTTTRRVETRGAVEALQRVRAEAPRAEAPAPLKAGGDADTLVDLVGGAQDKPVPPAPADPKPKGLQPAPSDRIGSLLEAKRRARQKMSEEQGPEGPAA